MSAKANFLDADSSSLEKNLKFVPNELEENLNNLFGGPEKSVNVPPRDYKIVTPTPGFCIKTFKTNTNEKYFINVCQTNEIPPPENISEEQLIDILDSDKPSSYRIPMSISEPRFTKDKSNNTVDVCDIAINPKFFETCKKSTIFKDFFLTLIGEALSEKYAVQLKIASAIILNNRKYIGTLVTHRVRNSDVKSVMQTYQHPTEEQKTHMQQLEQALQAASGKKPLVQELNPKDIKALKNAAQGEEKSAQQITDIKHMVWGLRKNANKPELQELQAEFYLPKCLSADDFTLDVGEDRIIINSKNYNFDKFIMGNWLVKAERTEATFDKVNKILSLRVPIISGV